MISPLCDIIVLNVPGSRQAHDPDTTWKESTKQFAAVAVAMGTSCGGSVPYRPREPNPRIPRKESKTPASHMHLPPFLAAVSSKPPTKSPSPNTATRVQVPPRAAAFKTKDFASTVPLPFPMRAAFAANECCASPALPKKIETSGTNSGTSQGSSGGGGKSKAAEGGNMTARRSNNCGGVRESDMLGAKPKKPPRLNNMTFTKSSERSSGNSSYNSGNKAFSRTPPFRNSPRRQSKKTTQENEGSGVCEEEEGGRQTWLEGRRKVEEPGRGSSDQSGCGLEVSAGSHLGPHQPSLQFGPGVGETSPGRFRQASPAPTAASASQRSRQAWQTPCVLQVNDLRSEPRSWPRLSLDSPGYPSVGHLFPALSLPPGLDHRLPLR
ncbi:hypothetical protein HPB51_013920 [Rhipicephalus microplus]|uniref:Uncharacterized protein n=1 Tax=Rhipicephalus microplus TaxID=6941 RepID=A0A9J6DGI2_RHIMP|nr:hypothetical protein HPB51_013920 [Rhipicephalus microplus]